jgi:general secretion pathway protein G
MIKKVFKNPKGFTLIELLIVVAIIGVLATLLMVNFVGVRQRARDAQRKSDLKQIQSALEIYRSDQGAYPTTFPNCSTSLMSPDCSTTTYMQKVPGDPLGSTYYNSGNYYYVSSGTTYTIASCLENTADSQGTSTSPGGTGCSSNFYYVLANP